MTTGSSQHSNPTNKRQCRLPSQASTRTATLSSDNTETPPLDSVQINQENVQAMDAGYFNFGGDHSQAALSFFTFSTEWWPPQYTFPDSGTEAESDLHNLDQAPFNLVPPSQTPISSGTVSLRPLAPAETGVSTNGSQSYNTSFAALDKGSRQPDLTVDLNNVGSAPPQRSLRTTCIRVIGNDGKSVNLRLGRTWEKNPSKRLEELKGILTSIDLEKLKVLLPLDDTFVKDIKDFLDRLDGDYSLFLSSGFLTRLIELFKRIHKSCNKFLAKGRGRQEQCWANKIPEKLNREELKRHFFTIDTGWKLKIAWQLDKVKLYLDPWPRDLPPEESASYRLLSGFS